VLVRTLVLVDSRHGLKDVDREMMRMLDEAAVGFRLVLTKADKVTGAELDAVIARTVEEAKTHPAAYPALHVPVRKRSSALPNCGPRCWRIAGSETRHPDERGNRLDFLGSNP
jgi:GTP-binding protein EngB required for normal cell division